jgi:hypothetical protein
MLKSLLLSVEVVPAERSGMLVICTTSFSCSHVAKPGSPACPTRSSTEDSHAAVLVCARDSRARRRNHPPNCPPYFPFSSIVRPATPPDPQVFAQMLPRERDSGRARNTTRLPPKTEPLGNPRFVATRAAPFATGTCELDRKTTIPAQTAAEDRRHCRIRAKQIAPRTFFGLEPPSKGLGLC